MRIFTVKKTDLHEFDDPEQVGTFLPIDQEWFDIDDIFFWNGEFCYVEGVDKQARKGTVISFSVLTCFSDNLRPIVSKTL